MSMSETSTFPKMGDDGYEGLVNMSGDRSPYTKAVPRHGPTTPDLGGQNKDNRGSMMVHETFGPTFRPVASQAYGTEYAATGRNIRQVPSAVGNRDFWAARAATDDGSYNV